MEVQQPTNLEILTEVRKIGQKVDGLSGKVNELSNDMQEFGEALQLFGTHVDERFNKVDERFDKVDKRFDRIEGRLSRVEQNIGYLKTGMVTKDYLDDKLADLHSDLVTRMKQEDEKVKAWVRRQISAPLPAPHLE